MYIFKNPLCVYLYMCVHFAIFILSKNKLPTRPVVARLQCKIEMYKDLFKSSDLLAISESLASFYHIIVHIVLAKLFYYNFKSLMCLT